MTKRDYQKLKQKYNSHFFVVNDPDAWYDKNPNVYRFNEEDYEDEEHVHTFIIPLGFILVKDHLAITGEVSELSSCGLNNDNNGKLSMLGTLRYISGDDKTIGSMLRKSERVLYKVVLVNCAGFGQRSIHVALIRVNALGIELHKRRLIMLEQEDLMFARGSFVFVYPQHTSMDVGVIDGNEIGFGRSLDHNTNYLAALFDGENVQVQLYLRLYDLECIEKSQVLIEKCSTPIVFYSAGLSQRYYDTTDDTIPVVRFMDTMVTNLETNMETVLVIVSPVKEFGSWHEWYLTMFSVVQNGTGQAVHLIREEKLAGKFVTLLRSQQGLYMLIQNVALFKLSYNTKEVSCIKEPIYQFENYFGRGIEILNFCQVLDGVFIFLTLPSFDNEGSSEDEEEEFLNFPDIVKSMRWILLDLKNKSLKEISPRSSKMTGSLLSGSSAFYNRVTRSNKARGKSEYLRYVGRSPFGPFVPDGSHDSFLDSMRKDASFSLPKQIKTDKVRMSCSPMQSNNGDLFSVSIYFDHQNDIFFTLNEYRKVREAHLNKEGQQKRAHNIISLSFMFQFSEYAPVTTFIAYHQMQQENSMRELSDVDFLF